MNAYQTTSHRLHALGFNVTAIKAGTKETLHLWKTWQTTRQTLDEVNGLPWLGAGGVGVISGSGGLRIFDFDEKRVGYPPVSFDVVATVLQKLDLSEKYPWVWRSGSARGWGAAVLCFEDIPAGIFHVNGSGPGVFKAPGVGFDHLELRWERCQSVLPPSTHPEGPGYVWVNGEPTGQPATVTAAQIIAAFQAVTVATAPKTIAPTPQPVAQPVTRSTGIGYGATALQNELASLRGATVGTRNETLNRAAFALGQLAAGGELDRGAVKDALLSTALGIGLDEREATATLQSGLDAGAREPRTAPPLPVIGYTPVPDEPPGWLTAAPENFTLDSDGAPDVEDTEPERLTATAKPDLSECPPLPAATQLDPALGVDACPWLDGYIAFSRQWAPRAYDGFHEAVGLWVLSTVAARRVKLDFGGERYPSLYLANVARSSVWTKSTAHHIGGALLDACGLSFLLAADDSTPQALLASMATPVIVGDWETKPPEVQERAALALAFAGQKGWDFDEFGSKVSAIMRESGSMADFRGILRRFDDCPDKYSYATIGRGENRLTRPYLALLGSMTPADMGPHAKRGGALWHDGFWARFAFVAPSPEAQNTMGRFPEGTRIFPADLVQMLRAWHDRLGTPSVDVVQRKDTEGKPTHDFDVTVTAQPPEVCTLGAGVRDAFYAYHDGLTMTAAASDNADLDGNYSRFAEKALRVAILLASLENRGRIELRHWARAQAIAERWRASLHNLYRTLNTAQDEAARTEDRVNDLVRRLGTATPVEVRRYAPDLSTSSVALILERLAKSGALCVTGKTRKGTLRYSIGES